MYRQLLISILVVILFAKPGNSIGDQGTENASIVLVYNLAKLMATHQQILNATRCCDPNKPETHSQLAKQACEFEAYVLATIRVKPVTPRCQVTECKGVLAELDKTGKRKSTLNNLQIDFGNSQGAIGDSPKFGSEKSWSRAFAHATEEIDEGTASTPIIEQVDQNFSVSANEKLPEALYQYPEMLLGVSASDMDFYSKSIKLLLESQEECKKRMLPQAVSKTQLFHLLLDSKRGKFDATIYGISCYTTVENFRVLMSVSTRKLVSNNEIILPKRQASFIWLIAAGILVLLSIYLCSTAYQRSSKNWTKSDKPMLV